MKVFVLGGDGFCGWPTALYLSQQGYDITILDNFSRRKIDIELGVESLTPIQPMEKRLACWSSLTGRHIDFVSIDLDSEYDRLCRLVEQCKPDVIVHFAEQRSAPYSMKGVKERRYTVSNNMHTTHNILNAIVESGRSIHLVHLGTMGVYGYNGNDGEIPEGYLDVYLTPDSNHPRKILHPVDPGSVYHMTKCLDQTLFHFYNKNYAIPITDLHQGVVWGTHTEQTRMHPSLMNRFDYDGHYGTVLNRFIVQAAVGHPLTVYGSGGQTRAFIHLQNSVECIGLAIKNKPADNEKVAIFNQVTEVHRVLDLANYVAALSDAQVHCYDNPRKEADENKLEVANDNLLKMGLKPIFLSQALCREVEEIANVYRDRCNFDAILSSPKW